MKKKTQYYPIFLFFCALVNVILNYILIPKYKLDGAGFATLFAYGFLLVLAFKIAQHTFKIDYDISKVGILLSIYGFIQIINFQFNNLILTSLSFFIYVLVTLLLIKPHDLSILELIIKGFKLKH
jgi:O-antigen/teichoic acid export membrane protein